MPVGARQRVRRGSDVHLGFRAELAQVEETILR